MYRATDPWREGSALQRSPSHSLLCPSSHSLPCPPSHSLPCPSAQQGPQGCPSSGVSWPRFRLWLSWVPGSALVSPAVLGCLSLAAGAVCDGWAQGQCLLQDTALLLGSARPRHHPRKLPRFPMETHPCVLWETPNSSSAPVAAPSPVSLLGEAVPMGRAGAGSALDQGFGSLPWERGSAGMPLSCRWGGRNRHQGMLLLF